MLCSFFCHICYGTVWAPPEWNKWQVFVTYLLTQLVSREMCTVWEGKGCLFYTRLGKEDNMVCKWLGSCKSHWTVWACPSQVLSPAQEIILCRKSHLVLEKPSYWQRYLIIKFYSVFKILCTWKCLPPLAEHHFTLKGGYYLSGEIDVFTFLPLPVTSICFRKHKNIF